MIDEHKVKQLKAAIEDLFHTDHGKSLLGLIEGMCVLNPNSYNEESPTSMAIAVGRNHVLEALRNLDRLTEDQILAYYNGESEDE